MKSRKIFLTKEDSPKIFPDFQTELKKQKRMDKMRKSIGLKIFGVPNFLLNVFLKTECFCDELVIRTGTSSMSLIGKDYSYVELKTKFVWIKLVADFDKD